MRSRRVLVDTSVWVNYLRGERHTRDQLELLMGSERIVISGLIKQEVLQGSRNAAAFNKL